MKKILSVLVMAMMAIQFINAGEVVTLDEKRLPAEARSFINQHFSDLKISYIKIDSEFLQLKKYEVVLINGAEIEFDSKGNWIEVDTKRQQVPANIIPAAIKDYVSSNFSNNIITKIERERYGFDVELDNDLSVKFNKKGMFLRLDD